MLTVVCHVSEAYPLNYSLNLSLRSSGVGGLGHLENLPKIVNVMADKGFNVCLCNTWRDQQPCLFRLEWFFDIFVSYLFASREVLAVILTPKPSNVSFVLRTPISIIVDSCCI